LSQFDIGFDTGKKLWFVQGCGATRHILSTMFVRDSNITLKNVMCDTYAWPEPNAEHISHGRLRFYGGNKIAAKGDEAVLSEITVNGNGDKWHFIELHGKNVIIKYNLPSMDWELDIDGTKLISKDIKGLLTGTIQKDKLRFELHDVHILYSNIVSLIDPELKIKEKPKPDTGGCIQ